MLVHSTTAEAENLLPSVKRKGNTRTLNCDFFKRENREEGKKMDVKRKKGVKRRERKNEKWKREENRRGDTKTERKVGRREDREERRGIWDVG